MFSNYEILRAINELIQEHGLNLGRDYDMTVSEIMLDSTDGSVLMTLGFGEEKSVIVIVTAR